MAMGPTPCSRFLALVEDYCFSPSQEGLAEWFLKCGPQAGSVPWETQLLEPNPDLPESRPLGVGISHLGLKQGLWPQHQ